MIAGNAPDILARLEDVRETANGWQAKCPSHDDNRASLSIKLCDDGTILMRCHANCTTEAVVQKLGMTMAALMPSKVVGQNDSQLNGKAQRRETDAYDYTDESGRLLFQAVRFTPKDFRQRQPKDGGWLWNVKGIDPVLYRLPELLAADSAETVFVVEGEKDVDRLRAAGLVGTCNVGGAGKWRAEYAEVLRGRRVVVLPDNDKAGREHGTAVANSLVGVAASVKVVELPNLPEKGDVSDWLDAGNTIEALAELVADAIEATKTNRPKQSHKSRVVVSTEATDLRAAAGRTDTANARRLAQQFGEDLHWCEPWGKFLPWDGRRWAIDGERRVDAMAKEVAEAIWREVGAILPTLEAGPQRELLSFARQTASARGITSMQSLARSEPGIPIQPGKLDSAPWALNCSNGTVDLRTGTLRPHDRADLITKLSPTEYVAGAAGECPLWEQTIDRIFAGNAVLIQFVQRLLGSAIVGSVFDHIFPIFWGGGSNGKGLFLETIMDVLGGDYSGKINSEMLLATKNDRHPTEKADLHGKRLVVASETDDGRRLREGLLKELTGGDTIKGRRMREDFWSFAPSHTLILLTNHRPIVRGTDDGVWRRLCLVPFVQKFWDADRGETGDPDLQADKHLREKLKAEHSGILRWLVDGCLRWQADGLDQPADVTAATNEYRSSQDVVGAFLTQACVVGDIYAAKAATLYGAYKAWCKAAGEHDMSQRRFGDAMSERGIERYKSDGVWYRGIALVSEQSEQWNQNP